jgi:glycosyltransferase involved in cell wall biosynthesis
VSEELIRLERPDVIHCNNGSMSNVTAAYVGRRHKIPVISHQKCFEHPGRLNRWLLRNSRYTHHIGTSPAISRHLQSLGLPEAKLTTMLEPVQPPKEWVPRPDRETAVLGMHSMLTAWKGQDVFLRAVGRLKRQGGRQFRAVIAGGDTWGSNYGEKLRQIVVSEGIEGLVEFRGHVSDVYGFLVDVDIAVHAAVQPEPFGRVVAEAMISGATVVVSDVGGPGEYVEHGVTGMRVPMGDDEALAATLGALLDDPERRRSLGQAARRFALAAFDPVRLGREMTDFYGRILNGAV